MIREIHGLDSVALGTSCRGALPRGLTPAQRRGLSYERKVEGELMRLTRTLGPSAHVDFQIPLHYQDLNGPGTAVVDFIFQWQDLTVVGETKLTWVAEAKEKLLALYLPLAAGVFGLRIRGLIICHALVPDCGPILPSLRSAVATSTPTISTLPWMGKRPMEW